MRENTTGHDKKIVILLSLIVLSGFAFLRSSYLNTTLVDDAYIFFRYAENISAGHGIAWNPGELPVEGYSSFLYLILILSGKLLSFNLELFSIIIGILCLTVHLYLSYLIYKHFYPAYKKENIFTIIIIMLSPAYLYWSTTGMDTAFYSMFLLISIYLYLILPNTDKMLVFKGVMFGLLCLVRYEALIFALLASIYLAYKSESKFKFAINKSFLLFCVGSLLIFTPYFLWRWNYFGYFLPNTFYAKTGGGLEQIIGGFFYSLRAFRLFYGLFWIVIGIILINFRPKMLFGITKFVSILAIASVITTIFIGGDHFSYGRFFIPVFPLLFIIIPPALNKFLNLNVLAKLKKNHSLTFIYIILITIIIFKLPYQQAINGIKNLASGEKNIVVVYDSSIGENFIEWQHGFALMGNILKNFAEPNESVAVVPVGIIGYLSKMKIIDMVGIVNPVIAHQEIDQQYLNQWIPGHNKGDGEYVLSQKPKYIQLIDYITSTPQSKPGNRSLQFKSINEIWQSESFHRNYGYKCIEVAEGWYYNLYERIN